MTIIFLKRNWSHSISLSTGFTTTTTAPAHLPPWLSFPSLAFPSSHGYFLASPQTLTSPVIKEIFAVLRAHSYEPTVWPCAWREWKAVNSAFSCLQKKKSEQPLLGNEWESAEQWPDGSPLLVVRDSTEASELHFNGLCGLTRLLKTTNRSGVQQLANARLAYNHPMQNWQVKDMFEPTSLFTLRNLKPL